MGASIRVRWPGITEADETDQPDFAQDCHAYADWMTDVVSSWLLRWKLRWHRLKPLLSFHSAEASDGEIAWTTPAELKAAAASLRTSLLERRPFAMALARHYRKGPGVESPNVELATDLADVATIAEYCHARGAQRMTLVVGW